MRSLEPNQRSMEKTNITDEFKPKIFAHFLFVVMFNDVNLVFVEGSVLDFGMLTGLAFIHP